MPNTLVRFIQRLQAPFRRTADENGNTVPKDFVLQPPPKRLDKGKSRAVEPDTQSKDGAPETLAKLDKGNGKAFGPDPPTQPFVLPEVPFLVVHAKGKPLSPQPTHRGEKLASTLLSKILDLPLRNGYSTKASNKAGSQIDLSAGDGIAGPSTQPVWPPVHGRLNGSPGPESEEQGDFLEGTIAKVNYVIKELHIAADENHEQMQRLEFQLGKGVDKGTSVIEKLQEELRAQTKMLVILDEENTDLKAAIDYGNKVLASSYRRQWELWRWVDGLGNMHGDEEHAAKFMGLGRFVPRTMKRMQDRDDGKMPEGYAWEYFGRGPNPPVLDFEQEREGRKTMMLEREKQASMRIVLESGEGYVAFPPFEGGVEELKLEVVETLSGMCEENCMTMREAIHGMVMLCNDIKGRATGIESPPFVSL